MQDDHARPSAGTGGMTVVQVAVSNVSTWGGPPRMVRDLTAFLQQLGVTSVVVTLTNPGEPAVEVANGIRVRSFKGAGIGKVGIPLSLGLVRTLLTEIRNADAVHIHELWHIPHLLAAVLAQICQRPYIVTVHGELNEAAVFQRRWLKKLAWISYQRRLLRGASAIHVLTGNEASVVGSYNLGVPIVTIPNGVDVQLVEAGLKAAPVFPWQSQVPARYILYLSRITKGKGLDLLTEAFRLVCERQDRVWLVIAGSDSDRVWLRLADIARHIGILDRMIYAGFVSEPHKFRLIADAQVYVLPSESEGMSVSTLEALACGTPVVLTHGCNFPEAQAAGAGFVVGRSAPEIAEAIEKILDDLKLRSRMSESARNLVETRFSSRVAAIAMLQLYSEMVKSARMLGGPS